MKAELTQTLTPTASALAAIWVDLLEIPTPRPDESFFELGAHSVLAALLVALVSRTFGIQLPPRSIFDKPRLQEFADLIDQEIARQRTSPRDGASMDAEKG